MLLSHANSQTADMTAYHASDFQHQIKSAVSARAADVNSLVSSCTDLLTVSELHDKMQFL